MFQVRTRSPVDEHWQERNVELMKRAGIRSNVWGTDQRYVEHVWVVEEFDTALRMKWRLELVPKTNVTVREHTTGGS